MFGSRRVARRTGRRTARRVSRRRRLGLGPALSRAAGANTTMQKIISLREAEPGVSAGRLPGVSRLRPTPAGPYARSGQRVTSRVRWGSAWVR
jgi:hypothetical protein